MHIEKQVLVKKYFYKWAKYGFESESKGQSVKWKTYTLVKKKFQAQLFVKKVMLTIFWGSELWKFVLKVTAKPF